MNHNAEKTKLIGFDIDGTIYETLKRDFPADTWKALREMKEKGMKLAICTSRAYEEMCTLPAGYRELFDVISCNMGAEVRYPKETVRHVLDEEKVRETMYWLEENKVICRYVTDEGKGYLNGEALDVDALFDYCYEYIPPHKQYEGERVIHLLYYTSVPYQIKWMEEKFQEESKWNSGYIHEIACPGVNKGSSLREIAAHYGYAMEETAAFGDGINDIPLVQAAGIGIAMGNGGQQVRDAADYVTERIDQNGLYLACKKMGWVR